MRNTRACLYIFTVLILLVYSALAQKRIACQRPAPRLIPGTSGPGAGPPVAGEGTGPPAPTSCNQTLTCEAGISSIVLEEVSYQRCLNTEPCCCPRETDDACVISRWESYNYMTTLADACVGETQCVPPSYTGDSEIETLFRDCSLGNHPKTQMITYSCVPNTQVINMCSSIDENINRRPIYLAYNSRASPRDKQCACAMTIDDGGEEEYIEVTWVFGSSACVRTTLKISGDDDTEPQTWNCRDDLPDRNVPDLRGMHAPDVKGRQLNISLDHLYSTEPTLTQEKLWIMLKHLIEISPLVTETCVPADKMVNIKCGPRQLGDEPNMPPNKDKFTGTDGEPDTSVDTTLVVVMALILVAITVGAAILAVVYLRWRRSKRRQMDSTRRRPGDAYTYPNSDVADFDYGGSISRQGSTYATINDLHFDRNGEYARISVKSAEYNKADCDLKHNDVTIDPSYSRLQSHRDSYSRIKETADKKEVVSDDYSHTLSTELSGDYNHTTDRVTSSTSSAEYNHIHVKDAQEGIGNNGNDDNKENHKLQAVRSEFEKGKDAENAKADKANQVGDISLPLPKKRTTSSDCSSLSCEDYPYSKVTKDSKIDPDKQIAPDENVNNANGYETAIKCDANKTDVETPTCKVINDGYETAVRDDGNDNDLQQPNIRVINDGYETASKSDVIGPCVDKPTFKVVNDDYETSIKSEDISTPAVKVSDGYEAAVKYDTNDTDTTLPSFKAVNDGYETAVRDDCNDNNLQKPNIRVINDGYETAIKSDVIGPGVDKPKFKVVNDDYGMSVKSDDISTPAVKVSDGYETAVKYDTNDTDKTPPSLKAIDDGYETAIKGDGNDNGMEQPTFKVINDG